MVSPTVQILTSLYNEEKCFDIYVETVERVLLSRRDVEYRFLLVDDGSTDRTWELIQQQCRASPRFRGLRLSRNFGAHTAETAGLDLCDADAVVILSADLQDPPEAILSFVEAWRQGADVVFGRRRMREDSRWRVLTSKAFEALLRRFAMPKGSKFATGGFLLMDRKVVECVCQMREANRLIFGLVAWTGFRQAVVEYDRQRRTAGRSAWSVGRMIKSMYDGLIGFSSTIPRAVTLLGAFFSMIGFIAAFYFSLNAIFFNPLPGWSTIMVILSLFFGIVFMILGTICEYLLRIYVESTRRPLYFIAADTAADDWGAATGNVTRIDERSMPEPLHRLPDFIIAGAPRSGTTWLYVLARRHPEIATAEPMVPEPKFFLVDELWQRGVDYYSTRWFDPLPAGRVLGEKSANYLESPEVAERISRVLPRVKMIFLLRNPVDRAYSNYLWSRKNGLETETFERALALEEQRERDLAPNFRYARPNAYFSRGLYAEHLVRFYNRFPREQILILRHEDVTTCPECVAVAFHRFLGVSEMPGLAHDLELVNSAGPPPPEPLPEVLRRQLSERYRAANASLATLLCSNFDTWDRD